jgi:single-strand DNA-binding protein
MRDINLTVVGNVGADPVARETDKGDLVVSFNLGSTPRVYDRVQGLWVDGPTSWFRVSCWRELGKNVGESIRKGERVIVSGRLRVGTYADKDGVERTSVELVAEHVGHELTFGTTRYTRTIRTAPLTAPHDEMEDDEVDAESAA